MLFSIATTPRRGGERYSFPKIAPLTFYPYFIMLCVKQGGIKYQFLSLWYEWTWDRIGDSLTIGEHFDHFVNGPRYIYGVNMYVFLIRREMWLDIW